MGRPYDHQYFFAGNGSSAGTMICKTCNEPIHNHCQDWMHYSKSCKDEAGWPDWAFHCFHRKCVTDQSGWTKIEKAERLAAEKHAKNLERMKAVAAELNITAPYELACLAIEALGESPDFFFD